MTPPTSTDGTDISAATIDGEEVQEITVDGQTVFKAVSPFDIEGATLEKSIPTHDDNNIGLEFKPDGTRMLTMDAGEQEAYQWDLSTAYDITTATVTLEVSKNDLHPDMSQPAGITYDDDGGNIYLASQNDRILITQLFPTEYDLNSINRGRGGFDFGPVGRDVEYHDSGDKVFAAERFQSEIHQISGDGGTNSGSYELDKIHSVRHGNVEAFTIVDGGTRLYTVEGRFRSPNRIHQHSLPNPFDIGTVNFEKVITISMESANGIAFKPDGTKMYISGRDPERIQQFAL